MVEAVIVIPVLILLWASLYYAGGLALSRQQGEATARSCAWLYSSNNCDRQKLMQVAPECDAVLSDTTASSVPSDIQDTLNQGVENAMDGGDAKGIVASVVGQLVVAPLAAAFTSSVDAKSDLELSRPTLYGGGIQVVSGRYYLACNLPHERPEDVASRAWKKLVTH
jgi:hypothetical protein